MRIERVGKAVATVVAVLALAAGCADEGAELERIELGAEGARMLPASGSVAGSPAASDTASPGAGVLPTITVYKSPTCGCCTDWEEHLRAHGFEVESRPTDDMVAVKVMRGVPAVLSACHTAIVDGYIVEGHVPADLIVRLLDERPDVLGLTVPGMPMGSPGMEGPYTEPYDVLTFDAAGQTTVFANR